MAMTATAACPDPPGDIDGNGAAAVADVQCAVVAVLWTLDGPGTSPPSCLVGAHSPDANCDGSLNVTDVIVAIRLALGESLDSSLDADGDQCPDACNSTDLPGFVVSSRAGLDVDGAYPVGAAVTLQARLDPMPELLEGGTVEIRGGNRVEEVPLVLVDSAGSWGATISTWGWTPAAYAVSVRLTGASGGTYPAAPSDTPQLIVVLHPHLPAPSRLRRPADLGLPGPGLSLSVGRVYSWATSRDGVFGPGWMHSYESWISEDADGTVAVVEPDLTATTFFYDSTSDRFAAQHSDPRTLVRLDGGGWMLSTPDGSARRYSAAGRLTALESASGAELTFQYVGESLWRITDSAAAWLEFEYDDHGLVSEIRDSAGRSCTYDYSADGRLASASCPRRAVEMYGYDENGRLASALDPSGRGTLFASADGRLLSVSAADGSDARHYAYDDVANELTITNALGHAARLRFHASGVIASQVAPDGVEREFSYDEALRPTSVSIVGGSAWTWEYDDLGRVVAATSPGGGVRTYSYQGDSSRVALSVDAAGQSSAFTYNEAGALVAYTPPGAGTVTLTPSPLSVQPASVSDAMGHTFAFGYDEHGQIESIAAPTGGQYLFEFDSSGLLQSWTEPAGAMTSRVFDAQERVVAVLNAAGAATTYEWDESGRLTGIAAPGGEGLNVGYDEAGRAAVLTFADGSKQSLSRDAAGRVQAVVDRSGGVQTFTRDAAGRLIGATYSDQTNVAFGYDALGRLASAISPDSEITLQRDAAGRVVLASSSAGVDVSYAYDVANRVTAVSPDGGPSIGLEYAVNGDLAAVANGDGEAWSTWAYLEDGRVASQALGNGFTQTFTYDEVGHVVDLEVTDATGTMRLWRSYAYDANGRLVVETSEAGPRTYEYDATGRLVAATYPNGAFDSFEYDAAGNRIQHASESGEWELVCDSLQRPVTRGEETLSYDARGHLVTHTAPNGAVTLGVGADGYVDVASGAGTTWTFGRDALGRLAWASANGDTTHFVYSGLRRVADVTSMGVAYWVPGRDVRRPVARIGAGGVEWLVYDAHGHLVATFDDSGALVATYDYRAYGEPLGAAPPVPLPSYRGSITFDGPGLIAMGARMYAPALGIFTSPDAGLDTWRGAPYAYAGNDPIQNWDPLGRAGAPVFRPNLGPQGAGPKSEVLDWYTGEVLARFGPNSVVIADEDGPFDWESQSDDWEAPEGPDAGADWNRAEQEAATQLAELTVSLVEHVADLLTPSMEPEPSQFALEMAAIEAIPVPYSDMLSRLEDSLNAARPNATDYSATGPTSSLFSADPTFVQPEGEPVPPPAGEVAICYPPDGALVRGDVPVFGRVCRPDVVRYRVEIGRGADPAVWESVSEAVEPECVPCRARPPVAVGDESVRGNLGTVDTGLTNYAYPTHPVGAPVNRSGLHTLRLVADTASGGVLESRVHVRVGRVVPNSLGGNVDSDAVEATLAVPPHALDQAFRVFEIRPAAHQPAHFTGEAVSIAPARTSFRVAARLEFAPPSNGGDGWSICRWHPSDPGGGACFVTFLTTAGRYATAVQDTGPPGAIYGLSQQREQTKVEPSSTPRRPDQMRVIASHVDTVATPRLRLSYRAQPDARANIFLRADDTWYDVAFLDDPKSCKRTPSGLPYYARIGMEPIAAVPDVRSDGRWHDVEIDLAAMLQVRSDSTWVETIAVADWDSTGYMRLVPGARGGADFLEIRGVETLAESGPPIPPRLDRIPCESTQENSPVAAGEPVDFERELVGCRRGDSGCALRRSGIYTAGRHGGSARLIPSAQGVVVSYDVTREGSWAGHWASLAAVPLADARFVDVRYSAPHPVELQLTTHSGAISRVALAPFAADEPGEGEFRRAVVPLSAFDGLHHDDALDAVSIGTSHALGGSTGHLRVTSIRLVGSADALPVLDFDREGALNYQGGHWFTYTDGESRMDVEIRRAADGEGGYLALPYGGVKAGAYHFALFGTPLGHIDVSRADAVAVRLRAAAGSHGVPYLHVRAAGRRAVVQLVDDSASLSEWRTLAVPMTELREQGVDPTQIEEVAVAIQWSPGEGELHVDDLRFASWEELERDWRLRTGPDLHDPLAGPAAPPYPSPVRIGEGAIQ